jgi:hypothetical protein
VVRTTAQHDLEEVVERSGRFVFRVWFGEAEQPHEHVPEELAGLGALLEWSSKNLLAVDAVDERLALEVADYLARQERADCLMYETGRS